MIASSRLAKGISLVLSGAATAAGMYLVMQAGARETLQIEGSAGSIEVAQGTSFADMAEGTATPVEAEAPPEMAEIEEAEEAEAPAEPVERVEPETVQPETAQPEAETPSPVPQPELSELAALVPAPVEEAQTAEPEQPEEAEILEQSTAVTRSVRPRKRPREIEEKAEKEQPKPKPKQQKQGNAQQNQRAGADTGRTDAPATRAGTGQSRSSTAAGNAAATAYPGEIFKRISRYSRNLSVNTRGKATVNFRIAANGGLAAISLSRSSGSSLLDRKALQAVQRAAPFPPPPPGAQTSFNIQIEGS